MSAVEDRLAELGLSVPEVAKPVAAYVPAVQDGRRIYTSGQLPMVSGELVQTGKVGDGHGLVPAEDAKKLAEICALNAIAAVKGIVGDLDKVTRVVKLVGFVASDPSFTGQPGVINGASELMGKAFGDAALADE
jgi:enamine deaminase RidA (YjgF/YER057c/UK114 family)